jgi:hypothetical protein
MIKSAGSPVHYNDIEMIMVEKDENGALAWGVCKVERDENGVLTWCVWKVERDENGVMTSSLKGGER